MSSSSHARVSSRSERKTTTNENIAHQPRAPSAQQHGGSSRMDRRTQSPPASSLGNHRRGASGSKRTGKNVEERRTERVQVTTREALTSRARSPERRPTAPPQQERERPRPLEPSRVQPGDPKPKVKVETLQGMEIEGGHGTLLTLSSSAMEPRGFSSTAYICAVGIADNETSSRLPSAPITATSAFA